MLLSRVAESLYWINRYLERAENISRFVEVSEAMSLVVHQAVLNHGYLLLMLQVIEKHLILDFLKKNRMMLLIF